MIYKPMYVGTYELKDPKILNYYKECGFTFIRRHSPVEFKDILRNPTIGCIVELFLQENTRCVSIDSIEARKMINKDSYF